MIGEIIIAVTVMIVVLIAIASIIFAIVETMERINPKLTWLIFPFFLLAGIILYRLGI